MQDKSIPNLDEMVNRLLKALPAGMREFSHEAEKNLRVALHSTLKKMGENDFSKIPNGHPAIEHRVELLFSEGVKKGKITFARM